MMLCEEKKNEISEMRKVLNRAVINKDLQNEMVLKLSRELDTLIMEYYLDSMRRKLEVSSF